MGRARDFFGKELDSTRMCISSYQPIIDSFGKVLIQVDDQDYSGDTRVLYEKKGKYGFLNFGWGSCSGCDALQSCRNEEEVDELINSLEQDVKWFGSLSEAVAYITSEEREYSYYSHEKEWKEFVKQAVDLNGS